VLKTTIERPHSIPLPLDVLSSLVAPRFSSFASTRTLDKAGHHKNSIFLEIARDLVDMLRIV
jgi:hypothetical protein